MQSIDSTKPGFLTLKTIRLTVACATAHGSEKQLYCLTHPHWNTFSPQTCDPPPDVRNTSPPVLLYRLPKKADFNSLT